MNVSTSWQDTTNNSSQNVEWVPSRPSVCTITWKMHRYSSSTRICNSFHCCSSQKSEFLDGDSAATLHCQAQDCPLVGNPEMGNSEYINHRDCLCQGSGCHLEFWRCTRSGLKFRAFKRPLQWRTTPPTSISISICVCTYDYQKTRSNWGLGGFCWITVWLAGKGHALGCPPSQAHYTSDCRLGGAYIMDHKAPGSIYTCHLNLWGCPDETL